LEKFKFGILIGNQKCEYLKDGIFNFNLNISQEDCVVDHFEKYSHYKNVTVVLGMEHKDPSHQSKWSDQSIVIKN
jgi:hypothetical protein